MEISVEDLKDLLIIQKESYKIFLEQKNRLEKYNEDYANIMDKVTTQVGKELVAEVTRANYVKLIELEIELSKLEKGIKELENKLW